MTRLIALSLLTILVAGGSHAVAADRMLYLTASYSDGGVVLEDARVVEGKVKRPRHAGLHQDRFQYTVTTRDGDVLFEGAVPDPTVLHVEYVDEDGMLRRKTARRDAASFVIRVPWDAGAHRVTIRRITSAAGAAGKTGDVLGSFTIGEEVKRHAE